MNPASYKLTALAILLAVAASGTLPAQATTVQVAGNSSRDACVDQWAPSTNFGKIAYLRVSNGYGSGGQYRWEKRALLWFDLSSIPQGSQIQRAELYLYYCGYWDTNPGGRTLGCYRNKQAWGETSATWNNKPSHVSSVTAYSTVPSRYGWMAWWVTNDVQFMVDKQVSNYGWTIKDNKYWGKSNIPVTLFYSREINSSFRPCLSVTYSTRGAAPDEPDEIYEIDLEPEIEPMTESEEQAAFEPTMDSEKQAEFELGDLNCDGVVDADDIDHFSQAVEAWETYVADHDGELFLECDPWLADINQDGEVNVLDLEAFAELLGT
ncbi:MAG: DNRLRE domain-containing protein [Planctomycetes bacterium]|nr:DNRLRE domain-containing protein [Planctomycetota bacterium]